MAAFALQGQNWVVGAEIIWPKIFTIWLCTETLPPPPVWWSSNPTHRPSQAAFGLCVANSSSVPLVWATVHNSLSLQQAAPLHSLLRILSPAPPQSQWLWTSLLHNDISPSCFLVAFLSTLLRTLYSSHLCANPASAVRAEVPWVSCTHSPESSSELSTQ